MKWKSIRFEAGLLLVCGFYFYHSLNLEYGSLPAPGPGFLPVVLGFLGTIIALCLLIRVLSTEENTYGDKFPTRSRNISFYRPLILYIVTIAIAIIFFETVGILPCVFAATVVFSKICGLMGWFKPLVLGVCTALVLYMVFALIFQIPMPNGLLDSVL